MDIQYNFKDILLLFFAIRKDEEIPAWVLEYEWGSPTIHIDAGLDDVGNIIDLVKNLIPKKKD